MYDVGFRKKFRKRENNQNNYTLTHGKVKG